MPEVINIEDESPEISIRDIYFIIFRHRKKAIVFASIVIIASVVFALFFRKPLYSSEAQLLVRIGRESIAIDRTAAPGEMIKSRRSRNEEIKTEIAIIKSRDIAEKVIDSVGLDNLSQTQKNPPPAAADRSFSALLTSLLTRAGNMADSIKARITGTDKLPPEILRIRQREQAVNSLLENIDAKAINPAFLLCELNGKDITCPAKCNPICETKFVVYLIPGL